MQLISSLFSNFFSSVRHLENHINLYFLFVPGRMVRDYWDETIQEKRKAICSIGGNFLLKRRCSATFTFLLLFRPVTNQQTSNQKHLYYAEYYAAFLRKPSSDRDPGVVRWVGRKKKARDIFQARGSFAHARKRFCRAFSPDPVTTPGSLRMLVGNL